MESEKAFGKSVMNAFKRAGFTCIRIESASTISGMPDLYIMGHGDDYFIELKNKKTLAKVPGTYKVDWRQGQQGWAAEYKRCHGKKHSWTFQCFDNEIHAIRMDSVFKDNIPLASSITVVKKPIELVKVIIDKTYLKEDN